MSSEQASSVADKRGHVRVDGLFHFPLFIGGIINNKGYLQLGYVSTENEAVAEKDFLKTQRLSHTFLDSFGAKI